MHGWCFKWLLMGGRLVLVKSILESMHVYWMALAGIPITILNNIKKVMINFLWSGMGEKIRFPLAHWEQIFLLKSFGGWGLNNIMWFNQALKLKIFWRGIFDEGLWGKILHDKYLGKFSMVQWIRKGCPILLRASNIWTEFSKVFHWFGRWLAWDVG